MKDHIIEVSTFTIHAAADLVDQLHKEGESHDFNRAITEAASMLREWARNVTKNTEAYDEPLSSDGSGTDG